jgi:hypothetical protein
MRKESSESLQEHSVESQRLVEIAYPDYTGLQKAEMALDSFITTLGDVRLQQHLLAVDPHDIATAVKAGNSYLQFQTTTYRTKGRAHVIQSMRGDNSDQELVIPKVQQEVSTIVASATNMEMAWTEVMEMLHMLVRKLEEPKETFKKPWRQWKQEQKASVVCRGCGEAGHFRTECRQPTGKTTPMSENASRPQVLIPQAVDERR